MREIDPHDAVDYILLNGKNFAKAKSERVYLEEYRKSLKALLMKRSMETAIGAQEREAYAHEDYQAMLLGLRDAIEAEEKLRWDLIGAQQRVEIWKTETYTNNKTDKLLR
jgi:hypothetical protein